METHAQRAIGMRWCRLLRPERLLCTDILRYLSEDVPIATALFLGCGDGSCLLASLAEDHPGLQQLTAVFNDQNASVLARAVLLLLLAAELDPNSQDDMVVLWEVWYCSTWGQGTWPRVKPFVERLAQGRVPWLEPLRADDTAALQHVWQWWLAQKTKQSTLRLPKQWEIMKQQSKRELADEMGGVVAGVEPEVAQLSLVVQTVVKLGHLTPLLDALSTTYKHLEDLFKKDLAGWFQSGTSAPGYTGRPTSAAHMANITFIEPGSTWRCPNINHPATPLGPFTASELESACKSGSPAGVLARACIARITQTVRNFQGRVQLSSMSASAAACPQSSTDSNDVNVGNKVRLHVQIVCMDALQLCLGMSLRKPAGPAPQSVQRNSKKGTKPQGTASESMSVPEAPLLFQAIDTSTLLDDVGLLALLVAAAPRLAPGGHLYTSSHKWHQKGADTLPAFLDEQALCVPLSLTPTILGVRLLTDLTTDRPETPDAQDYIYRTDGFRELVWSPIPAELRASPLPQLQPQILGGPEGSIEQVLKTVMEQLCCVKELADGYGLMGLVRGTPQLFAWLLASMIQRVDMSALLDGGSNRDGMAASMDSDSTGKSGGTAETSATAQGAGTAQSSAQSAGTSKGGGTALGYSGTGQHGSTGSTQAVSLQASHVATQRLLWAIRTKVTPMLPGLFQLPFKAGIDILRSSLQQNAPLSWLPADVPACPGLVQLDTTVPQILDSSPMGRYVFRPFIITGMCGANTEDPDSDEGAHAVDSFSMGYADRISLFLPADHGFNLQHVRIMGFGLHHEIKKTPVLRPPKSQVVHAPPTLAQMRLPAACAQLQHHPQHQQQLPPPLKFPASSSEQQQQQQGIGGMAPEWVLRVKSLTEHAHYYNVVLQLQCMPAISCSAAGVSMPGHTEGLSMPVDMSDMKLRVQMQDVEHGGAASQRLLLKLAGPVIVQPCQLMLPWPVAGALCGNLTDMDGSNSDEYSILWRLKTEQQVEVDMRKAEAWQLWPGDEHWPGAAMPLNLEHAAPVSKRAAQPLVTESFNAQFYLRVAMTDKTEYWVGTGGPSMNNVREFVAGIVLKTLDQPTPDAAPFVLATKPETGLSGEESDKLLLYMPSPVLMTEAGRLLLPVTVIDPRLCHLAGLHMDELVPDRPPDNTVPHKEMGLIKGMLQRNAVACQPTAAQRALLPKEGQHIPHWYSSYLSFNHHQKVMHELYLEQQNAGKQAEPPKPFTGQGEYVKYRLQELMNTVEDAKRPPMIAEEILQLLAHPGAAQLPTELCLKAGVMVMSMADQLIDASTGTSDPDDIATVEGSSSGATGAQTSDACAQCGRQGCKLLRCGKCGLVQYCDRDCQVAHWKQHKAACKH